MEERAVRSIPVSLLTFASNKVITVATTIVLARLLGPSEFGLFALAYITMSLLSMFNDLGVGRVLVQRQDLDDRGKGTVFTIMLVSSACLAALLVALSTPVAAFFDQPRLSGLLPVIAATLLLSGPVYFHEKLFERELEFKRRFVAMSVRSVTYGVLAISLAVLGLGVLGMIIGHVGAYLTYLLTMLWLAPYRVRPAWERSQLGDLLRSGRGYLVQGGVQFAEQNTDNFTIGKLLGSAPLGAYFLAYRLAELTYTGIAQPVTKVTFPGFARMRHRGEEWAQAFLSSLRLTSLAALPVAVVLSAAASPTVRLLYGPKWLAMIVPLAILGLWAMLRPLEVTLTSLLNAIGEADAAALVVSAGLVLLVPGTVLAASFHGLEGVAWVMVAHTALVVVGLTLVIGRRAGVAARRQWAAVAPMALAAAVSWGASRLVVDATASSPALLSLAAAGIVAVGVYAITLSLVSPAVLREAAAQASRAMRQRSTTA